MSVAIHDYLESAGRAKARDAERARVLVLAMQIIGIAPRIRVKPIIAQTAAYYGISMQAICGDCRIASLVRARHVACYLAYELTGASLAQIARVLGDRDHSAIHHARQKIAWRIGKDAELAREVAEIRAIVRQSN